MSWKKELNNIMWTLGTDVSEIRFYNEKENEFEIDPNRLKKLSQMPIYSRKPLYVQYLPFNSKLMEPLSEHTVGGLLSAISKALRVNVVNPDNEEERKVFYHQLVGFHRSADRLSHIIAFEDSKLHWKDMLGQHNEFMGDVRQKKFVLTFAVAS